MDCVTEAQSRFSGTLITRQMAEYEEARVGRVFNGRKPQRFPEAVLFVESIEDVVAAVHFARENNLTISVRSGGHSWDGWSVRDGSLLLDLQLMNEMSYDEHTGLATVSPTITGGVLNPFLKPFGVFFPGGHCPTVGLGGFLLQGGMGWNCRGWGWACERIAAMDVVTADGKLLHANANENSDIFWAARGSGPGFFAIVARFYLRPLPLPKALTRTIFAFPMDVYGEVMPWFQGIHGSLDGSVELVAIGLQYPVPGKEEAEYQHSLIVYGLAFADTLEQAEASLAPLLSCPVLDRALSRQICVPTTMQQEYEEQLRQNPAGARYAADNHWIKATPEEALPLLKPCFQTLPTTRSFALWYSMAPLLPLSDMALSLQTEIYLALYVIWDDAADDARCRRWLHDRMKDTESISEGYYLGDSDIPTRSSRFMAEPNFLRLEQLRKIYDPDGRICSYRTHNNDPINVNPWQKAESTRT